MMAGSMWSVLSFVTLVTLTVFDTSSGSSSSPSYGYYSNYQYSNYYESSYDYSGYTTPPWPNSYDSYGYSGYATPPWPNSYDSYGYSGYATPPWPNSYDSYGYSGYSTPPWPNSYDSYGYSGYTTPPWPNSYDSYGYSGYTTPPWPNSYDSDVYSGYSTPSWPNSYDSDVYSGYSTPPWPNSYDSDVYSGYSTPPWPNSYDSDVYSGYSTPSWPNSYDSDVYSGYSTPPWPNSYDSDVYSGYSTPSWPNSYDSYGYSGYTTPPWPSSSSASSDTGDYGYSSSPSWYGTGDYSYGSSSESSDTGYYGYSSSPSWYGTGDYGSSSSSEYDYSGYTPPPWSTPYGYGSSSDSYSSDSYGCTFISPSPSVWTTPSTGTPTTNSGSSGVYGSVPSLCYSGISLDTIVKRDATRNDIPRAAVKCTFQTDAGYKYLVSIGSTSKQLATSNGILDADDVDQDFVWIQDIADTVSGFGLEQWYHCGVTIYDSTGTIALYGPVYSPPVTPVYFNSTVEVDRNGFAYFGVYINVPFTCPDGESCTLNVKFYDVGEDYSCYDTQISFVGDTCGVQHQYAAGVSDVPNEQNVGFVYAKLATKNNDMYWPRSSFTLRMLFETEGSGAEQWLNGEFSTNIQGTIKDEQTHWNYALCYIENDPYVRTFDYMHFYFYGVGVYDAVIHTDLPVRVQVLTEMCVWGGSCSCGVIVQAGRDVFMIDHCNGAHTTTFLSQLDNVLDVYSYYNSFVIYLPHGMVVRASVSNPNWFWWASFTLVNIQIYPTPFDMGKIDGICGNFDGDWYNDWYIANSYSSWNVTGTSDSLDRQDLSDLQSYTDDDVRCVCMGSNGQGDATCSVKETDTCTYTYRYGTSFNSIPTRKRRSASRHKRWEPFTLNTELAEAMKADTERSMKKRRDRRSETQPERVKRGTASLTFNEAKALCEVEMVVFCGSLTSSDVEDQGIANITARIENCAYDTMINDASVEGWARGACQGLQATVEAVVENAVEDLSTSVVAIVLASVGCPGGDCNGHGTCGSDGQCTCEDGYGMVDCTSDLTSPATILEVTGDGICDTATQTCSYIRIVADVVVDGCFCRIEHTAIDIYNNHRVVDVQEVSAVFISIYEVYCEVLPSKKRRRRSTSGSALEVADGYNISISNDGTTFSAESSVVSLDTTCLTYNSTDIIIDPGYCIIDGVCYGDGTIQSGINCTYCDVSLDVFAWTLYAGQCLIDGICYTDGETMAGDVCHSCNSTISTTVWIDDESSASCSGGGSDDDNDGPAPYQIALIVICVLLGVGGIAAVVFYFVKEDMKKRAVGITHGNGLYDKQRNNKFHLRPDSAGKTISAWMDRPKPGNIPDNLYKDCELGSAPVPTITGGINVSPGPSTPGRSSQGAVTASPSTSFTLPSEATP